VAAEVLSVAEKGGHQPPNVLTVKLDVLDQASVDDAANCIAQDFGGLDILLNNAGWPETAAPIGESDPKELWYTMEVNIKGTYLSTRAFLPILLKGGMKTII
jgi:NADP-dependent 3-hydroxy acid dehydrogenase YdfG